MNESGYTLVELLLAMTLAVILLAGLGGMAGQVMRTHDQVTDRNELNRQARFALDQVVRAVSHSTYLMLPYNDKDWSGGIAENIHDVVAVTQDRVTDLDGDGTPDADNDGDGRFDEDPPADWTNDAAAGIYLIDDDVDGSIDEGSNPESDDESTTVNDDPVNGVDDDDDQNRDEDPPEDINADGCPGVCGVDDDADGTVDEGGAADDDEDGQSDEDWLDPVVFYLNNGVLIQRTPVPWDEDGSGFVTGRDFIEQPLAEYVTNFRVERLPRGGGAMQLLDVTLEITSPETGEVVSLHTRVRVGGAL